MYRTVFLRISFCFVMAACSGRHSSNDLPYYDTPDFTPIFASTKSLPSNHTIGAFSFTDQHGKKITEHDIDGKIHIANFMFTRCGSICPVMTKHMKMVQKEFINNPDVVMLSFSVTPWMDSVARLKIYADQNNINSPNWHLLTGDKNEIYKLARQSYYAEEELGFTKDNSEFLHTEHILLVDKNRRIRGIYNGTLQLEAEQLIKDITVLQKEKE